MITSLSRRSFLKFTGLTGTGLVLGAALPGMAPLWANATVKETRDLNLFVSINSDNTVNIVCHRSEMGQGIRTGIPQIVAEELCADWNNVIVVQGEANEQYGSQNTDGSRSIRRFYQTMREMGASARSMLEHAAADLWSVSPSEVYAENNFVFHKASSKKVSFGYLADKASAMSVPSKDTLQFKSPEKFKLIGKDVPIVDLPNIVTGNTVFGQDIKLEGMLYASIERSPVVGAKVSGFNETAALNVKGVRKVIKMPEQPTPVLFSPLNGVAVLADNTWAAMQGRKALNVQWGESVNDTHDSEAFLGTLAQRVSEKGKVIRSAGNAYDAIENASKTLSATYTVPYLVHAPMEPPAATAVVKNGSCEVWACTQTPQSTKNNVAQALGIDAENVRVNVTLLGGGFGRKSKPDFSVEAALLAKQSGHPVKVVWSREDDIRHGYYHAVSAQHFEAAIDDEQNITGWIQRTAFPSISWTFNGTADEPSDGELSLGFGDIPFAMDNLSCETQKASGHLRIGWVRSVSNIHHAFARGAFVDELAEAIGLSSYDTWMKLIGADRLVDPKQQGFEFGNYGDPMDIYPIDTKRLKNTLKTVVEKSGASEDVADNEGWGISVHRSFVSYVAVATKVRVTDGKVQVLEVHSAIDAGTVVNPDRVRSQQEGSMIFGLSIALMGEITVKNGAVEQSNYHDYPVTRMSQSPAKIETYIIASDAPPGGVGEPGTPPVAASLVNAVYQATGKRIRSLPVSKHLSV